MSPSVKHATTFQLRKSNDFICSDVTTKSMKYITFAGIPASVVPLVELRPSQLSAEEPPAISEERFCPLGK